MINDLDDEIVSTISNEILKQKKKMSKRSKK